MASSSGGSSNTHANCTRHVPPHRRVTSFADLFSSDKLEDQQTINQQKSYSSIGGSMNFELVNNQDENIELIPTQMSSFPAAASLPPLSPPLSPSFSPSDFFVDHIPVLYSPSCAPPSPTAETFAGLFSSEEEINYADLCSFAPTSAVMTAMDSLGDKDDDGTSINSQAEFSAEPAPPLGPLPPQDIIIPTDETIHCFPQNIIPAVESTHCFPQDFLTIQSAHTSPQDITVVGTSSVHGNSAYLRKQRKSDDGYRWIKYGEKPLRGSNNPRSYYKCNHPKCPSRKKVERDFSGNVTHVIYKGTHNHPKPPSPQRIPEYPQVELGEGSSMRDAAAAADDDEINEPTAKRLNGEGKSAAHQRRITRKPRVVIQTTSDVAVLDDGYRWRKYGEKMVKKNPNPRSYYKCTSYGCMVTKQIERAPDDLRLVLATYEGRHNHAVPAQRIRVTYPLGRLPVMNNNTSPTAIMPSATSGHSDPTMLQTMQNQTPNANQMQQTQNVGEEPNDNSLFYFDDSFLDNLFK